MVRRCLLHQQFAEQNLICFLIFIFFSSEIPFKRNSYLKLNELFMKIHVYDFRNTKELLSIEFALVRHPVL